MIPNRFATEYPERCLQLLKAFEPIAQEHDLNGTFSIMLAASVLIIPWERVSNKHPLVQEHGSVLQASINRLEKQKWLEADFWGGTTTGKWHFSRIMGDPNNVAGWRDDHDRPSFSSESNTINRRNVPAVFRVLRNALAHGNIIYLDRNGWETEGARVHYLAFLARYEENEEQKKKAETYRLVTVREKDFLPFVRAWARWVAAHHQYEHELRVA
jgi:hypothetical protein